MQDGFFRTTSRRTVCTACTSLAVAAPLCGRHSSAPIISTTYEALDVGRLFIINLASWRGSFTSFHSLLMIIVARSFAE